jgi:hypothetical protein
MSSVLTVSMQLSLASMQVSKNALLVLCRVRFGSMQRIDTENWLTSGRISVQRSLSCYTGNLCSSGPCSAVQTWRIVAAPIG